MNDKARLLSNITFLFEASLINIWMELMFINVILTLVVTSTFSPFCNKVLIIPTCPYLAAVWILRAPPCNTKQTFQSKGIRVKYKYHNFQLVAQYYQTSKSQKFSDYTIFILLTMLSLVVAHITVARISLRGSSEAHFLHKKKLIY